MLRARPRVATLIRLLLIALAVAVAVTPVSPTWVERWYGGSVYPRLQQSITSWSNLVPFALFDAWLLVAIVGGVAVWFFSIRRARAERSWRPLWQGVLTTLSAAALAYLWFAFFWGLNYDRRPLDESLAFDASRVRPEAVLALGERAVREANARYEAAHGRGFPGAFDTPPDLVQALHDAERLVGRPRATVPGRPKRSLLAPFFRMSGTDGLTAPFFLETLLNPDLTAPERPIVLAHEWAHLSGVAPEADASFVAILAALGADVPAQYSAWLSLALDVASRLPPAERQRLLAGFDPGPRRDWEMIAARLRQRVPIVERVSWLAYDQYLRSQGVDEGIVNYGRVIELLIGTDALSRIPESKPPE